MIHVGDCLQVMRALEANNFDSIVTDPPYGIGFMGKAWDGKDIEARLQKRRMAASQDPTATALGAHKSAAAAAGLYDLSPRGMRAFQEFSAEWAREAIRVAKPGAYCVAFASPRTFHRLVCGLEEAGWEIRDTLMWVFGSGFPKSHNGEWGGTALKPAWEPIVLARKPLEGTVEANWREHGTGALNIDGCRIEGEKAAGGTFRDMRGGQYGARSAHEASASRRYESRGGTNFAAAPGPRGGDNAGRWPANLVHDGSDEVVALFPRDAGAASPVRGTEPSRPTTNTYGQFERGGGAFHGDNGSAARFFYCAKASPEDRNDGADNHHPTVKPTALMRWLCRLVTPPGGKVLDPFAGSGSTGRGAIAEGFRFEGIEIDPDYAAIGEARTRAIQPGLALGVA